MTDRLLIRHAEATDYPLVIGRVDRWWDGRPMRAMLPRLFFVHFRPTSFVAELEGGIVGFLCGFVSQTSPEIAYVHFIGVDPATRRLGVGRRLYERLFAAARALGCQEIHAVTAPTNSASIAFHEKVGFSVVAGAAAVAEGYDGPGEARIRFRLTLDAQPGGGDAIEGVESLCYAPPGTAPRI